MRTLSAGLVLAAVLFAAGCGGSNGGGNGGSSQESGLAAESASAVVADASKAAQDASSFHMAGTIHSSSGGVFGSNAVELDLSIVRGKGATGSVTAAGGAKVDLIVAGNSGYMRASSAFWKHFAKQQGGSAAASFAATLFGDKWLKFPANNKQFQALTSPAKANSIFKSLTSNHGKLENQGEKTYKGQSVVAITDTTKGGTLYVAATGTPYPVALTKTGGKSSGALTFDEWNQPVTLTAPKGALDLSQFGG
jgi:hypothetical protein